MQSSSYTALDDYALAKKIFLETRSSEGPDLSALRKLAYTCEGKAADAAYLLGAIYLTDVLKACKQKFNRVSPLPFFEWDIFHQGIAWLKEAHGLGSEAATLLLAKIYVEQGDDERQKIKIIVDGEELGSLSQLDCYDVPRKLDLEIPGFLVTDIYSSWGDPAYAVSLLQTIGEKNIEAAQILCDFAKEYLHYIIFFDEKINDEQRYKAYHAESRMAFTPADLKFRQFKEEITKQSWDEFYAWFADWKSPQSDEKIVQPSSDELEASVAAVSLNDIKGLNHILTMKKIQTYADEGAIHALLLMKEFNEAFELHVTGTSLASCIQIDNQQRVWARRHQACQTAMKWINQATILQCKDNKISSQERNYYLSCVTYAKLRAEGHDCFSTASVLQGNEYYIEWELNVKNDLKLSDEMYYEKVLRKAVVSYCSALLNNDSNPEAYYKRGKSFYAFLKYSKSVYKHILHLHRYISDLGDDDDCDAVGYFHDYRKYNGKHYKHPVVLNSQSDDPHQSEYNFNLNQKLIFARAIADYAQALILNPYYEEAATDFSLLLYENEKDVIFEAIQLLPKEQQIIILHQCLLNTTTIGGRFWEREDKTIFGTSCWYNQGTLKDICYYLAGIDPTFNLKEYMNKEKPKITHVSIEKNPLLIFKEKKRKNNAIVEPIKAENTSTVETTKDIKTSIKPERKSTINFHFLKKTDTNPKPAKGNDKQDEKKKNKDNRINKDKSIDNLSDDEVALMNFSATNNKYSK